MKEEKCDGNCCDKFFEDYDDIEDDYEIQRLEDIIKICEFLIKTKKHRKEKRETLDKLFNDLYSSIDDDKDERETDVKKTSSKKDSTYIYRYYSPKRYKAPFVPWWEGVWF